MCAARNTGGARALQVWRASARTWCDEAMTDNTYPRALNLEVARAVRAQLDARDWDESEARWAIDWHTTTGAAATVSLRPGVIVAYRRGTRVLYIENPRAYEVVRALARAGLISPRTGAVPPVSRARGVARVVRAGAERSGAGRGNAGS